MSMTAAKMLGTFLSLQMRLFFLRYDFVLTGKDDDVEWRRCVGWRGDGRMVGKKRIYDEDEEDKDEA